MKKIGISLLLVFSSLNGASAKTFDDQIWTQFVVQGDFSTESQWGGYLELQPRYSFRQKKFFENLLRPAVYYKSENAGLFFVGYMSRFNSDIQENEKRYWAQWAGVEKIEKITLSGRVRYELRDLNLQSPSHRTRFFGRVMTKELSFYGFNPFLAVEVFYNLNSVGSSIETGFQQLRNSVGVSRKFEGELTFEAAYTRNSIDSAQSPDQDNNVLQFSLIKNL
jgi:hypothetical protein